jgi:hypothetical protein
VAYLTRPAPDEQPVPVQVPPPGADPAPLPSLPFFHKHSYKPARFLHHFPAPEPRAAAYNVMSFLGPWDPHGGKYLVPRHALDEFLAAYTNTATRARKRMYLAEAYHDAPFKCVRSVPLCCCVCVWVCGCVCVCVVVGEARVGRAKQHCMAERSPPQHTCPWPCSLWVPSCVLCRAHPHTHAGCSRSWTSPGTWTPSACWASCHACWTS